MTNPDDIRRQVEFAVHKVREQRRRDRWARSATIATWSLVVTGLFAAIVALLTLLAR